MLAAALFIRIMNTIIFIWHAELMDFGQVEHTNGFVTYQINSMTPCVTFDISTPRSLTLAPTSSLDPSRGAPVHTEEGLHSTGLPDHEHKYEAMDSRRRDIDCGIPLRGCLACGPNVQEGPLAVPAFAPDSSGRAVCPDELADLDFDYIGINGRPALLRIGDLC